ncbi:MAG TPA: hypothetical protein PKE64_28340 [Anaerolineae bacterium]|nr:hypothetical protein [Anaerolineae bacterium]
MLQIHLDPKSPYVLHFPRPHEQAKVLDLAQAFVTYDEGQPEEQQSPYTPRMRALLDQMIPSNDQRRQSEAQRTIASDTLKQFDNEAKVVIDQIVGIMKAAFPARPSQAENWGLTVKQGTGHILKPATTRRARLALLNAYIKTEESRPEYERFSMPALDEVMRVRDGLQENLSTRDAGTNQRRISVATGKALTLALHNHLQAAAVYLLSERFGYKVSLDLSKWGYTIFLRNGRGNGQSNGQPEGANGAVVNGSH